MRRVVASIVLTLAVGGTLTPASPAAAVGGALAAHAPNAHTKGDGVTARQAKPRRVVVKPGRYRGNFYTSSGKRLERFTFRVTKNRKITKFRALLNVTCSYYPPEVETHPIGFPTTPIKSTGKFGRVWKPNSKSRIVLRGKLKQTKLVSGSLDYTVGICVRTAQLKARRVGK